MISAQQNKYVQNSVLTASPAQLLIMLSDGAIRFCKQAIEAIHQKKHVDADHYFRKVQDIIEEFIITLDKESKIADELLRLYEYFLHRLVEANIKKQVEPAEEVLGYLVELKETWVQAAKLSLASKHG